MDFAAWSTYTYVLDNPIIFVDPDGRQVKIANEDDQQYFIAQLRDVIGSAADLFSFNKNGFLKIDKKGTKKLEGGDVKDIVLGFQEVVKDDAIIEFSTQINDAGEINWNPEIIVMNGDVGTSQPAYEGRGLVLQLGAEGVFGSANFNNDQKSTRGVRGIVGINKEKSNNGVFTSSDGQKTTPCTGCVIIHEFLDQGRNFINSNYKSSSSGIKYHNKALRIKGTPERNGNDHKKQ